MSRPPKPTALKKLQGNPGRRKLNENEPKPRICKPKCPIWLDELGKEIFKNKSDELFEIGLLTKLDADVLANYCDMLSQYHKIRLQLEDEGYVYYAQKIDSNGLERMEPKRNPNLVTLENLRKEIRFYSTLIGTNPSARVRMQVIKIDEDDFDDFLNKK